MDDHGLRRAGALPGGCERRVLHVGCLARPAMQATSGVLLRWQHRRELPGRVSCMARGLRELHLPSVPGRFRRRVQSVVPRVCAGSVVCRLHVPRLVHVRRGAALSVVRKLLCRSWSCLALHRPPVSVAGAGDVATGSKRAKSFRDYAGAAVSAPPRAQRRAGSSRRSGPPQAEPQPCVASIRRTRMRRRGLWPSEPEWTESSFAGRSPGGTTVRAKRGAPEGRSEHAKAATDAERDEAGAGTWWAAPRRSHCRPPPADPCAATRRSAHSRHFRMARCLLHLARAFAAARGPGGSVPVEAGVCRGAAPQRAARGAACQGERRDRGGQLRRGPPARVRR